MKCFLIEIINPEHDYFLMKWAGRWFWAGAANNTKTPKIYMERKDAERVVRSGNTYISNDDKRIVAAELIISNEYSDDK